MHASCMHRWWSAAARCWPNVLEDRCMTCWRACVSRAASTRPAALYSPVSPCGANARPICRAPTFSDYPSAFTLNHHSRGHRSLGLPTTRRHDSRCVHATNVAELARSASLRQDYDASQIQVDLCAAMPLPPRLRYVSGSWYNCFMLSCDLSRRCWRAWTLSGSAQACTLAAQDSEGCTTW